MLNRSSRNTEGGIKLEVTFRGRQVHNFNIEKNYENYDVRYFVNILELAEFITKMKKTEKIIVFVGSITQGAKLKETLEKAGELVDFLTANNKETDSKDIVTNLTMFQKFKGRILIATSVLDVGVSIVDTAVTTVAIIAFDKCTFLQMLGRIRINNDNNLTLLIHRQNSHAFATKISDYLEDDVNLIMTLCKIATQDELKNYIKKALDSDITNWHTIRKYVITDNNDKMRLNCLSCPQTLHIYSEFVNNVKGLENDPDFYIKKQLSWIKKEDNFSMENYISKELREQRKKEITVEIRKIINTHSGQKTFKEIKKQLQNIHPLIRRLDKSLIRGNVSLSVKKFNQIMKVENMPFTIVKSKEKGEASYEMIETSHEDI